MNAVQYDNITFINCSNSMERMKVQFEFELNFEVQLAVPVIIIIIHQAKNYVATEKITATAIECSNT